MRNKHTNTCSKVENKNKLIRITDNFVYGHFTNLYKSGIYYIKCNVNNKIYIGSSNNIGQRLIKVFSELRFNKHKNYNLQSDFNNLGINNFSYGLLEEYHGDLTIRKNYHQAKIDKNYIYNPIINKVVHKIINTKSSHNTEEYRKKMSILSTRYKVGQFNVKGECINIYNSAKSINEVYPNFNVNAIRSVCNGHRKSYKKIIWKYLNDNNEIIHK